MNQDLGWVYDRMSGFSSGVSEEKASFQRLLVVRV